MKPIIDRLLEHGIVCKKLIPISPKELGSRKKITLYIGTDLEGYRCSVMVLKKKSRVLRKEVEELIALHATLMRYADTMIPKRYIRIDAPLCSKAKAAMEEAGWVFV